MFKSASMIGPSHVARGIPSQDAYGAESYNEFVIAAVADGAGSKANAELGARYSVDWVIDYTINNLQIGLEVKEALDNALLMTIQELKQLENYKSYGATLAVCVKSYDSTYIRTVGDAFAVVSGEELVLVRAEDFNPAPNITTFLTSDVYETASYSGPGETVFLCSDGLEFGSLQNGKLFEGFWKPLSENIVSVDLDSVLESMDAAGKIFDDATIVAV